MLLMMAVHPTPSEIVMPRRKVRLTINGGAGNDTIIGSPGNDLVSGGTGNDVASLGIGCSIKEVA
jgi:Ca2+-binding RTX toxin-like protein